MRSLRAPKAIADRLRILQSLERRSEACLNCGTSLAGPFCSACGQRDVPPYPDVRELVVDAFWELSGWDGRFAATVRKLFTSPGALTRDFLEGRRVRYLSPVRLYLMASLVYFLVAAAVPSGLTGTTVEFSRVRIGTTAKPAKSTPQRVADREDEAMRSQKPLTGAARDSALTEIAKAPAAMRPFLRRVVLDPAGFRRGLAETMPRMLFALLPVFAAIIAVFYRRRKYPEHLFFSIHLHSFIFLALTLAVLTRFVHVAAIGSIVRLGVAAWIVAYATLAFRRTYGGSLGATLAKEVGIGVVYLGTGVAAFLATIYWVALFA